MLQSKKILVPNDFSVKPLILLKKIMESNPEENYHIILLHGIYPPDGISDLLFYSKTRVIKEMENEEFVKSCNLFKSKFRSRITAMYAEVITYTRKDALNSFLEISGIDEIYLPGGLEFSFKGENTFNIIPLLKQASVPVKYVAFENQNEEEAKTSSEFSSLFISELTKSFITTYDGRTAIS